MPQERVRDKARQRRVVLDAQLSMTEIRQSRQQRLGGALTTV